MPVEADKLEVVEPVGMRVLIRRDPQRKQTRAGIILPDGVAILTLTGRIVAISPMVELDSNYANIKLYSRVVFHPQNQLPVDVEDDAPRVVVPVEDIVAIIGRPERSQVNV